MADIDEDANARNKTRRLSNKKQNKKPSDSHVLRRRQPRKLEEGDNVFYVNTKTNTKAHLNRCKQLIKKSNETDIIIYCIGAAIQRGILLALQICEEHPAFKIHTETFTTELIDDLEPTVDEADYEIQRRHNSALRIKVFRDNVLEDK